MLHSELQTDRLSFQPTVPPVIDDNNTKYTIKEYQINTLMGDLASEYPKLAAINPIQVVPADEDSPRNAIRVITFNYLNSTSETYR